MPAAFAIFMENNSKDLSVWWDDRGKIIYSWDIIYTLLFSKERLGPFIYIHDHSHRQGRTYHSQWHITFLNRRELGRNSQWCCRPGLNWQPCTRIQHPITTLPQGNALTPAERREGLWRVIESHEYILVYSSDNNSPLFTNILPYNQSS